MDNVLDLKKKRQDQESAESQPAEQETETTRSSQPQKASSVPVMTSWSGPLYSHAPNPRFLIGAIFLLCGVGVFFIFFERNIFAVTFFFLSALMLFITSRQEPPVVDFVVGPTSVRVGPKEYRFSDIRSFWVEYNPGGLKELSVQLDQWYKPYLKIPLMDQDPVKIRIILLKFIPEIEHEEAMLESLSRLLGV